MKMLLYQILASTTKTNKQTKNQLPRGMINLNYQIDHIIYQMF